MFNETQRLAGLSPEVARNAIEIAQAIAQRRLEDADRALITALAQAPAHAEILRLCGLVQLARAEREAAIGSLLQARALRADDPLIHDALGTGYEAIFDYARARASLHRACTLAPDNAGFWFNYAARIYADGDNEGAQPVLQRVLSLAPKHAGARILAANIAAAEGRRDDAERQYREVIADRPDQAGMAWWWLAVLKPMALTEQDITAMRHLIDDSRIDERERAAAGVALAYALEQRGDFASAFTSLTEAHERLRRSGCRYDARGSTEHTQAVLRAFDPAPVGAQAAQGEEVIFIVSLPRSGSTLTEQILAAHSHVEGGGEIPDLLQTIMDESDRVHGALAQWAPTHSPQQWRLLGQRYLARTRRWRKQRPRFTDKRLDNWLFVGAIVAMLPQARVVIVTRDPLENCLGCWRYMFTHDYTHEFADLAARWREFDAAARHWQALYPQQVRVQPYEDLVADPETQIRALLEFCNLPFEVACLQFHNAERRVTTPSASQVREPLRRDTARAHKYGALLDPLRKELGLPPFQY